MTDSARVVDDLTRRLHETAEAVVPWFLEQMPDAYVRDTPASTRLAHLAAIVAARTSKAAARMKIEDDDGQVWTFIEEKNYPGLLAELVRQLPADRTLRSAKVHTAADGQLVLDVFRFGDAARFDDQDASHLAKRDAARVHARSNDVDQSRLDEFFACSAATYVESVTPHRSVLGYELWRKVVGRDDTAIEFGESADGQRRISVAIGNGDARTLFLRIVAHLGRHDFDIRRAYVDGFEHDEGSVSVLGFVVEDRALRLADLAPQLERELLRLRWIDDVALGLAQRHGLPLVRTEVAVALVHLAHAALASRDRFAFARERLYETLQRRLELTLEIVGLFLDGGDGEALQGRIDQHVPDEHDRRTLTAMLAAARATIASNVHRADRYALAIRFEPALLADASREQIPFGCFFVHGRDFDGFHVRFRDVARGGVRVVLPRGPEEHAFALERLYDETYGLASAQQLKNKDIPEGGSKAVVLVEPAEPVGPSLKAFADGLLDVILETGERLYLGPDENVTDELIEWIVRRAATRGYATPNAFMSSKPGAGINHKVYGVTSEGVTVFLAEALRSVGIDPKTQRFTVKLTGGPDGDVAGNEIKILHRMYGDNACIVGIADGSGSATDPDGLDHDELLRLVDVSSPIVGFDPTKLGPNGRADSLEASDGLRRRNDMIFDVFADAFVPAGGRPQTIHEGNWKRYLDESGRPMSRVIVEGANLFITPRARELLSAASDVRIVKDSSANKCGVICSSYEIAASMLLDPETFMSVKVRFVSEVLERLRALASQEAKLLFREHARHPDRALPELSIVLSRRILAATDAIEVALSSVSADERVSLERLVRRHLPPVLLELAGDHIEARLPAAYRAGIIAASLSTQIVYREGSSYLADLPPEALAQLALDYLREDFETQRLIEDVRASDLTHKDRIVELLDHGGTRSAVALGRGVA